MYLISPVAPGGKLKIAPDWRAGCWYPPGHTLACWPSASWRSPPTHLHDGPWGATYGVAVRLILLGQPFRVGLRGQTASRAKEVMLQTGGAQRQLLG